MDIKNKTTKPLRVPLPAGKRLFLVPGGVGQVVPKALEHPPLKALIEAGEIEVLDTKHARPSGDGDGSSSRKGPGSGGPGAGGVRHTGDR